MGIFMNHEISLGVAIIILLLSFPLFLFIEHKITNIKDDDNDNFD